MSLSSFEAPKTDSAWATLYENTGLTPSLAWNADSTQLASSGLDHSVVVWDAQRFTKLVVLRGHSDYVRTVAFHPDGKTLASGSWDGKVRIWNISTGDIVGTIVMPTNGVAWSPDGKRLAVFSSLGKVVRLYESSSLKLLSSIPCDAAFRSESLVPSFSPDGRLLAVPMGDDVGVIDMGASGDHGVTVLRGHTAPVRSVSFSPQGTRLATASEDATVRLYDFGEAV